MQDPLFIDRLIGEFRQQLPAEQSLDATFETALRTLLETTIDRLQLISRAEFSQQEDRLTQLRARLDVLEREVSHLEHRRQAGN